MPAETIRGVTGISAWFLSEFERAIALEREVREMGARIADPRDAEAATLLATVKRAGFGDRELAQMAGVTAEAVRLARMELGLVPGYAMVDTCAAEFAAETPYFYATYAATGSEPELPPVQRPAALVIGSGPVRIGQGIEFDYCAVQAAAELREQGWQAVMINSNPETVSTDFDASSRLYFEPLDPESVRSVVEAESPETGASRRRACCRPSSSSAARRRSTWPSRWPRPGSRSWAPTSRRSTRPRTASASPTWSSRSASRSPKAAWPARSRRRWRWPIGSATRSSFGRRSSSAAWPSTSATRPSDLVGQLARATVVDPDRPVRIDRYLEGVEVDVDAIADGETVLIPGLLEHVERAGVHSGDSVGMFPPQTVSLADQELIVAAMDRIVRALDVHGLVNAQFIVRDDGVYLIEVNPRASRTVPFMSKVTGVPMVKLAVRIALGETLRDMGWPGGLLPPPPFVAVKAPAFSTAKLRGVDPSVGPGMQSTGEVIGIHTDPRVALAKAMQGAALIPPRPGSGRGAGADLRRGTGPRELPRVAQGSGPGRLPVRGHRRDGRGTAQAWATRRKSWPRLGRGRSRAGRRSWISSPRARSGSWSTRRRPSRARSATPPRSAWPPPRRGSCA